MASATPGTHLSRRLATLKRGFLSVTSPMKNERNIKYTTPKEINS
jgi:hypothetical protein